ncbi:hypothetical protein [Thalassomonas sp. M1454]|uniref:hypothetical protein n=1 Tax=Thalassomonas sp. M1454 TaxID=2594477 RepID=UPI00118056C0|nr:hypothetical protein [Thalassomonas sp. M1454]TRX52800.1 hypothetical protein FNN08_15695 [Thalassomonas sp. M1454]
MFHSKTPKRQHGASLVMAVFMIVVFSVLAAVMAKMISVSSETISYEVLGTRAYLAADTGNQWAQQKLFPVPASNTSCADVNSATVPNINSAPGLIGCAIESVQCQEFTENGVTYFTLTTTGLCNAGNISANRTIEVNARGQ